eukprot:Opistho-2@96189
MFTKARCTLLSSTSWSTPPLSIRSNSFPALRRASRTAAHSCRHPLSPTSITTLFPSTSAPSAPVSPSHGMPPCFKNNTASVQMQNDGTATITFNVEKSSSLLCGDDYVIMTVSSWHLSAFELHGEHKVTWKQLSADEVDDVNRNGFRVFRFDESMTSTIADIYETAALFLGALDGLHGPHVPDAVANKNIQFLKDYANFELPNRTVIDLPISESDIHSGDVFGILRLDGLDPLICWGTGGRLGHTAVALRIDGELYVLESQTKSNYWPKNLIQRNKFSDWIANAINADYNVVLLPLSAENRAKFDEKAALDWFTGGIEGLLYGFPNFLSSWLDVNQANLPPPLDENFVMTGFALFDPIMDEMSAKLHFPSLWKEAFNKRLDTVNLTAVEAYAEAAKHGMTFADLVTMPEHDEWIYSGSPYWHEGPSMVCNVFVCNIFKAAGLFKGVANFNCAETVPLDLYEMQMYDDVATALPGCAAKEPGSQLCQLLGKHVINLPHFNTVKPFDGMRAKCPSTPPTYSDRFAPGTDSTC